MLRDIVTPAQSCVFPAALLFAFFASGVGHAQQDALDSCLGALEKDTRFAAIAGKLSLGARADATPQMLADMSTAAGKQGPALADWIAARSDCARAEAALGNASYRPPRQAYRLEAENAIIEAAADLHDRSMSFGSFNRRRQAIAEELRGKVAGLSQRIQAQRSALEQADQQARERQQLQRTLEEAERQAAFSQQQASQAQQAAERANRRPPAPVNPAYPIRRPRIAAPVPYASCFQLDGRIICTYR